MSLLEVYNPRTIGWCFPLNVGNHLIRTVNMRDCRAVVHFLVSFTIQKVANVVPVFILGPYVETHEWPSWVRA